MPDSLRMRVVEAGARAMYEAEDIYRDSWESQPDGGIKDWYRRMSAVQTDAKLDCLAENADEWEQSAAHALAEPVQESAFVAELLAVLREDR